MFTAHNRNAKKQKQYNSDVMEGIAPARAAIVYDYSAKIKELFRNSENLHRFLEDFSLEHLLNYCSSDTLIYLFNLGINLSSVEIVKALFLGDPEYSELPVTTTEKIVDIVNYLKTQEKFNINQEVIYQIYIQSCQKNKENALAALLALDLIKNINEEDTEGHTAFYYALLHKNQTSIDLLKEKGAVLNTKDIMELEKATFSEQFTTAIQQTDHGKIQACLHQVMHNKQLLSQKHYRLWLELAIQYNNTHLLNEFTQFNQDVAIANVDDLFTKVTTMEMAHALFDYTAGLSTAAVTSANAFFLTAGLKLNLGGKVSVATHRQEKIEGGGAAGNLILLRELIRNYLSHAIDTQIATENVEAIDYTLKINKIVSSCFSNNAHTQQLVHSLFLERYLSGKPLLMTIGWTEHGIGLSIRLDKKTNKTYLSISNRGEDGLQAIATERAKTALLPDQPSCGTIIYELNELLDINFFKHFEIGLGKAGLFCYPQDNFMQDVAATLDKACVCEIIPANPQSVGNCAYVNPMRAIQALTYSSHLINSGDKEVAKKFAIDEYMRLNEFDKNDFCKELSNRYQIAEKEKSNDLKPLTHLILKFILSHHHIKNNVSNFRRAHELFSILNEEVKEKIRGLIPERILSPTIATPSSLALFDNKTNDMTSSINQILIDSDNLDELLRHAHTLTKLIDLLSEKGMTGNDILKITIQQNTFILYTKADRQFKLKVKDGFFEKELQVKTKNVRGQYEFILPNIEQLDAILTNQRYGQAKKVM